MAMTGEAPDGSVRVPARMSGGHHQTPSPRLGARHVVTTLASAVVVAVVAEAVAEVVSAAVVAAVVTAVAEMVAGAARTLDDRDSKGV